MSEQVVKKGKRRKEGKRKRKKRSEGGGIEALAPGTWHLAPGRPDRHPRGSRITNAFCQLAPHRTAQLLLSKLVSYHAAGQIKHALQSKRLAQAHPHTLSRVPPSASRRPWRYCKATTTASNNITHPPLHPQSVYQSLVQRFTCLLTSYQRRSRSVLFIARLHGWTSRRRSPLIHDADNHSIPIK